MGIGVGQPPGQAYGVHKREYLLLQILLGFCQFVDPDGIRNEIKDTHSGIQGGEGILENQLHVLAQSLPPAAGGIGNLLPVEGDGAFGGVQQPQNHTAQGGFSAA